MRRLIISIALMGAALTVPLALVTDQPLTHFRVRCHVNYECGTTLHSSH